MKKCLVLILLIGMLVFPVSSFAKILFVSEKSAGNGSGETYLNRASVAMHNSAQGSFANIKGAKIILSGEITTPVIVPGNGTIDSVVEYDGKASSYYSTAKDAKIVNFSSSSGYSGFYINNKQYITVKNISIDWNYTSEMGDQLDNKWGLRINGSNNIVVDSNIITRTHNGIYVSGSSYKIKLISNHIEKIAESGIYLDGSHSTGFPRDITIGGKYENGNTIKNCTFKSKWDQNRVGYDIRVGPNVENVVISYNHLYADKEYHGMSGILSHSSKNLLIENNTIHGHQSFNHRAGISLKSEQPQQLVANVVIRNNKIFNQRSDNNSYAGSSAAIVVSGNWEHIYIYGNYITNCGGGINVNYARWTNPSTHSDGVNPHNMHIWSNIISETSDYGLVIDGYTQGSDKISNVHIYNNTLYRPASSASLSNWAGIANRLSTNRIENVNIKNNIIVDSRINTSSKYAIYTIDEKNILFKNNSIYYSSANDKDNINPKFRDPSKGNFILNDNSPMINAGAQLVGPTNLPYSVKALAGTVDYNDALDPENTYWNTIPPKVSMVKQSNYGSAWDRGAYVFKNTNLSNLNTVRNLKIRIQ